MVVDVTGNRPRKVLCAPDSFKETLSAVDAAGAMAAGAARAGVGEVDRCPVADGGEGSLDVLVEAMGATVHRVTVTGPLGEPVEGRFGVARDGRTAVVELAEASGLGLVDPARRDPTRTTTYGTGELMAAAVRAGCDTVIVCIGGSATVDGGAGMAQALGGRFLDRSGAPIERPLTGGGLVEVVAYDPPPQLPAIRVACDVTNPLCGPRGAATVYGPQKGATAAQVSRLDDALAHLSSLRDIDPGFAGAGAAGGCGWGLVALLGATLHPGVDVVLQAIGFDARCAGADLVLTGEGRLDAQSLDGKASVGVARAAARLGVPAVAIVGQTHGGAALFSETFADVVSLADRDGLHRALAEPATLLAEAAAAVCSQRH